MTLEPSAPAEDLRMDVGALFGALWARALRILFVTAVLVALAYGVLMFVPKLYESSSSLLVEDRTSSFTQAATGQTQSGPGVTVDALISSQIELIKSRDTLLAVVDTLNLRSVPEFNGSAESFGRGHHHPHHQPQPGSGTRQPCARRTRSRGGRTGRGAPSARKRLRPSAPGHAFMACPAGSCVIDETPAAAGVFVWRERPQPALATRVIGRGSPRMVMIDHDHRQCRPACVPATSPKAVAAVVGAVRTAAAEPVQFKQCVRVARTTHRRRKTGAPP